MATFLLLAPIGLPAAGAVVSGLSRWNRITGWLGAACSAGLLAVAIGLAVEVVHGGPRVCGVLRVDGLSAFMLVVIGAIALLATAATPSYLRAEIDDGRATERTARRHSLLVQAFLAAMVLAVLAANLGLLWVAVEATTVATAFLVGQRRTRAAVEAAWKYVVIC
ncbi:MAG TPA: hydrogenase, partial [Mycobacteriales bacterium]|nr:hydrogenase [Mycobacteriales bacterium]